MEYVTIAIYFLQKKSADRHTNDTSFNNQKPILAKG